MEKLLLLWLLNSASSSDSCVMRLRSAMWLRQILLGAGEEILSPCAKLEEGHTLEKLLNPA